MRSRGRLLNWAQSTHAQSTLASTWGIVRAGGLLLSECKKPTHKPLFPVMTSIYYLGIYVWVLFVGQCLCVYVWLHVCVCLHMCRLHWEEKKPLSGISTQTFSVCLILCNKTQLHWTWENFRLRTSSRCVRCRYCPHWLDLLLCPLIHPCVWRLSVFHLPLGLSASLPDSVLPWRWAFHPDPSLDSTKVRVFLSPCSHTCFPF